MKVIYADTWDELTLKMIGYYHDHCHHYFSGKSKHVAIQFEKYIKKKSEYVFLYKEDTLYKK